MFLGELHDEAPFSGSDFKMQGVIITEKRFPLSEVVFGFLYDPGACRDHVTGTRYVS